MYKFENWTWCLCWLPLLGIGGGWVHTLADWCLLVGAIGFTRWRIGDVVRMASCAWFTGSARDRWLWPCGYRVGCNGTQQRHHHPAMAASNGTTSNPPTCTPTPLPIPSNGAQQWHPELPLLGIGAGVGVYARCPCWVP